MLVAKIVKFNESDVKMLPYVKENKHILNISLDMCILLSDIATIDRLQCIRHICYLPT